MRLLPVALLLLGASPLQAQGDRWQRQVDSAMTRANTMAAQRGYTYTGQRLTGSLALDESELRPVQLGAGGSFLLIAVCDGDCRSLNLVLRNPHGDEIAYDREESNAPFVQTTNARGGEYQVKVIMRSCRRGPCRYGIAVFRRR